MFKTAQEVLLANTMISVQDYAACWGEWGGVVLRVDREKALCTTFPGCRSGRLDFLHRDHRVALSGGNPRQTWRRGAKWGTGKPALGRRRGKEKKGVGHTAWERQLLSGLLKGPYTSPPLPHCHRPILSRPPLPPQKWLIFSQFCGLESRAKIQSPNTSHTTIESSFLSLLRVLNVNFLTLFARFKCGVKYPHVTIADWEKGVKECITKEVK